MSSSAAEADGVEAAVKNVSFGEFFIKKIVKKLERYKVKKTKTPNNDDETFTSYCFYQLKI